MEGLDYWRLCDELNVIQAALLVVGVDPAESEGYGENWNSERRPVGYEAAKQAISRALVAKQIAGKVVEEKQWIEEDIFEPIPGSVDLSLSHLQVESLRSWLKGRGVTTGFFFPDPIPSQEYLDASHPRYAPKLAAAVSAWITVGDTANKRGTPKQALSKWLRENAAKYGLTDDEGIPNETGIEETAKVANWQTSGGAPRTPTSESAPD